MDEDQAGASYAGQYETILRVTPAELPDAVRRCWASAFSEHVTAYRRAKGTGSAAAKMAVLVQQMVTPDAAGVAFSADPVSGNRETVVVSAVRGLGDRLVDGSASPDEWVVQDEEATCRRNPEGAIDAEGAQAVANLAKRLEAWFGVPQDVEWALAGGRIFLLQSRPITALPEPPAETVPVPVEVPDGFWERELSHAPVPWSPMVRSVALGDVRNQALRRSFAEFGFLAEGLEMRQIGGWEYVRLVPLGGKDRPAPPPLVLGALARLAPAMRRRVRDARAALRGDKAGGLVDRWYAEWQPEMAAKMATLRDGDLAALTDAELDDDTGRAVDLLRDGVRRHFLLHGALMVVMAELAFTCRDLLGWSDEETCALVAGLSTTSTSSASTRRGRHGDHGIGDRRVSHNGRCLGCWNAPRPTPNEPRHDRPRGAA